MKGRFFGRASMTPKQTGANKHRLTVQMIFWLSESAAHDLSAKNLRLPDKWVVAGHRPRYQQG
jgi:hypothetical protein